MGKLEIVQALLILGRLVERVIPVDAATGSDGLDRLLGVAAPLSQVYSSALSPFPSRVHHIVHLLLRPPRFMPHITNCSIQYTLRSNFGDETLVLTLFRGERYAAMYNASPNSPIKAYIIQLIQYFVVVRPVIIFTLSLFRTSKHNFHPLNKISQLNTNTPIILLPNTENFNSTRCAAIKYVFDKI